MVGRFADQDKVVAAVCHGPAGLVAARRNDGTPIVRGYRLPAFTNAEEAAANLTDEMPFLLQDKLTELGGHFVGAPLWSNHVEVDRKLVTRQNPQSDQHTAEAVIQILEGLAVSA